VTTRQDEFERIAMPHAKSLLRVARRLAPDLGAAEDAVQEALLHAWRAFDQFEAGTNARAWLFRIMIHELYAQGRKLRSRPQVQPLDLCDAARKAAQAPVDLPFVQAADVNRALHGLSREHRTVLLLAAVEGFTCREMAAILLLPIGTVMSRLSRARKALRDQLEPSLRRTEYLKQEAS
jgi:RNA polymerase sigma-70 factor, ECF subfamily